MLPDTRGAPCKALRPLSHEFWRHEKCLAYAHELVVMWFCWRLVSLGPCGMLLVRVPLPRAVPTLDRRPSLSHVRQNKRCQLCKSWENGLSPVLRGV